MKKPKKDDIGSDNKPEIFFGFERPAHSKGDPFWFMTLFKDEKYDEEFKKLKETDNIVMEELKKKLS